MLIEIERRKNRGHYSDGVGWSGKRLAMVPYIKTKNVDKVKKNLLYTHRDKKKIQNALLISTHCDELRYGKRDIFLLSKIS